MKTLGKGWGYRFYRNSEKCLIFNLLKFMYLEALVTKFVLYLELTIVKYNDKKIIYVTPLLKRKK